MVRCLSKPGNKAKTMHDENSSVLQRIRVTILQYTEYLSQLHIHVIWCVRNNPVRAASSLFHGYYLFKHKW